MPSFVYLSSFIFGLMLPVYFPFLPDLNTLLLLGFLASFICLLSKAYISPVVNHFITLACLFAISFCINSWHIRHIIDHQMPSVMEGLDLVLDVEVIGLPVIRSQSLRFDARVIMAQYIGQKYEGKKISDKNGVSLNYPSPTQVLTGKKVRLSWRKDAAREALRAGQKWRLYVRLKRPRGFANPGGFDYQVWLLQQHISATGYVKIQADNVMLVTGQPKFFDGLRQHLDHGLFSDGEKDLNGILRALILGDKSFISQAQWQLLVKTGTAHLMAISGLHIGLVAGFAFFGIRRIMALVWLLPIYQPSPLMLRLVPALFSILASGIYAGIADFAIPTQRAWLLVTIFNFAHVFGRTFSVIYSLILAAAVILMINPFSALQNGFWLSFGAVICLLFCFSHRRPKISGAKSILLAQFAVFVGLAALLNMRQLPLTYMSPLANIIAVPIVSFFVIPFLFAAGLGVFIEPGLAQFFLSISQWVMAKLWWFLQWLSQGDSLLWLFSSIPLAAFFAISATVLLLSPRALGGQLPGVALLAVCLMLDNKRSDTRITVLDVGQGLSVVVESDATTFVYDVGAKYSDNFDIGSRVLAPFLRYQEVREIDLLAISHGDNDHAGGLVGLLNNIKTRQLASNEVLPVDNLLKAKQPGVLRSTCLAGQRWDMGSMTLKVLWPDTSVPLASVGDEPHKHRRQVSSNNTSCVILLTLDNFSMLLTGDIERSVERRLLANGTLPMNIDVLIAPHHGSNTSSSIKFISHLSPQHVIFSSGYKNRYRHPATKVLKRYEKLDNVIWNTADDGAIVIHIDSEGEAQLMSERETHPKPWY